MKEKTGTAQAIIEWLFGQDREKLWDIKEHKEKRSKNANDYCWVLCTKIAHSMIPPLTKDEVYLKALKDYGQWDFAVLRSDADPHKFFKYFEWYTDEEIDGVVYSKYMVFFGSSDYDTKEMSILIDGIVRDAEELGIETIPPHELQRLKEMWK